MMSRRLSLMALLAVAGGCASDKSYALVSVFSMATGDQFNGVTQLLVDVDNGTFTDHLTYPKSGGGVYRFDDAQPLTFSISYNASSHSGTLNVAVTTVDASGAATGCGRGSAQIDREHVTSVTVLVARGAGCTVPDGGAGNTTDAINMCVPLGEPTCGADRSCVVQCLSSGNYVGRCTGNGLKRPGELCEGDCVAGSECFALSCDGKPVRTCMKLCTEDGACAPGKCSFPITCGAGVSTPFHACTTPCDPIGPDTTGCAPGLKCFLLGADETPECDCPRPSMRVGGDGANCTNTDDCQLGYLCVSTRTAGTQVQACRALCRLDTKVCPVAGTTCTKLIDPGYNTFGGCLPP
jgi:hypothetical protein